MKKRIDYSVYLVTDSELNSAATLEEGVEKAILGGVTLVQLREKQISSQEYYRRALSVKAVCDRYGIPLIINDRVDIAMAVDADGVHLGQGDMPVPVARRLLKKDKIIGVSARSVESAERALKEGADYLGVGAMFATGTKTDAKVTDISELRRITGINIPIVIIGGLNEQNIPRFSDIDIDGVAVASAIMAASDITAAAARIKAAFNKDRRPIVRGIKGAIFDLDGTLLDSMDVWKNIDLEFLGKRGLEIPVDYMQAVSAKSFNECAEYTIKRFSLPETPEMLMREWNDMAIGHYTDSVQPFPYVKEYLCELKSRHIKMAVATSLKHAFVEPCLKRNGMSEFFDSVCSVDDVGVGKESPAVFEYAAKQLGLDLSECIIFDDALSAIKAAKQTEAKVVGVYEKHSAYLKESIRSIADMYISDFKKAPVLK